MIEIHEIKKVAIALVISALMAAFACQAYFFFRYKGADSLFGFFAFVIAMIHAVFLGLPAYFIAKKFNLIYWWVSVLAGFVIGFTPIAIFEGVKSLKEVCLFGFCGAIGGFGAWAAWDYMSNEETA